MGVMATLCELVLPVRNSVGEHQRIGPFFANGPRKVRKFVVGNIRVRHRVTNVAEHSTSSRRGNMAPQKWNLTGESNS